MRWCLSAERLGRGDVPFGTTVRIAAELGFDSVDPNPAAIRDFDTSLLVDGAHDAHRAGVGLGTGRLPVAFRDDDEAFRSSLKQLIRFSPSLRDAGVRSLMTWIEPSSDELAFDANFALHRQRLAATAEVLAREDILLGLEYLGTRRRMRSCRFEFVHTLQGLRELILAIDIPNVGVHLDSFQWHAADERPSDLEALFDLTITGVDIADAPLGSKLDDLDDLDRYLAMTTGVVDNVALVRVMRARGYRGHFFHEPFDRSFGDMPFADVARAARDAGLALATSAEGQ